MLAKSLEKQPIWFAQLLEVKQVGNNADDINICTSGK